MNDIIFLNKYVNLFCVGISKVRQIHLGLRVGVVLDQLHYDIVLVVMAACGAAAQCIRRQPHRQICTKPGITEVQLRRFAESFEFIVGIRYKQIDDAQSDKHVQPFLRRTRGNVCRLRQCGIIDLLRHERGASNKELSKTHSIGDAAGFGCITH